MYRDVATARELRLIDHFPVWQKLLEEDPALFHSYVPDTIHPIREGALQVSTPIVLAGLGIEGGDPSKSTEAPCWKYLFGAMNTEKDQQISRKEYEANWAKLFVLADTNKDGLLDAEEFSPAPLFALVDTNADGNATPAEFTDFYAPIFSSFDSDKDGNLSIAERTF